MFDLKKMPDYENKVVKLVNGKLLVNESVVDKNTFFQCKYANKHFDLALNLNFLLARSLKVVSKIRSGGVAIFNNITRRLHNCCCIHSTLQL